MKKGIVTLTFALALGLLVPSAHAEHEMMDGYCPMLTMKHAKELGLSKNQEVKIQEIKDQMWAQLKPIAEKYSAEVEAVLNKKQKAKYKEVTASGSCGCGKDGGSCEAGDKDEGQDKEKK